MKPDYEVRISPRARRLRIQLDAEGRLLVVVPKGFDQRLLPGYLAQHQAWIERTRARLKHQQKQQPALYERLPAQIALPALGEQWQVEYGVSQRHLWRETNGTLRLRANESEAVQRSLGDWLNHQAKQYLPERLQLVAQRTGLRYADVRVRAQKTRWGSCSSKKNINLNRNLLFLPLTWVDYLCLHELCHTRVMNHSADFWRLVATYEPDFQRLERSLTRAVQQVPLWARP